MEIALWKIISSKLRNVIFHSLGETKLVIYERCIGPDRFRGLAFMIIIGEVWQHVDKYVTRLVVERLNPFPQEQEEEVYLEVGQVFGYSKSTTSDMCPSMWQHFLILQT